MQFSTVAITFFGLFAAQAIACGTPGDQCNSPGATDCGCNAGYLVNCELNDGGSGYSWRNAGDCPNNPNGLACVNGACTVSKKLRFAA